MLDVIIEGFTFDPVFVAVPEEQCGGCIFHVNVKHAVLTYGMPDPSVHVLDAKLFCPVSTDPFLCLYGISRSPFWFSMER